MQQKKITILLIFYLLSFSSLCLSNTLQEAETAIRLKNFQQAISLLTPLAEQGNPKAQYRLASLYRNGQGTEQNDNNALRWMQSAAQQGHSKAQYYLALMYLNGRGIEKDKTSAQYWLNRAASQNHRLAKQRLQNLAEKAKKPALNNVDEFDRQLRLSIKKNNPQRFRELIENYLYIDYRNNDGLTLLMEAVIQQTPDIVRILLAHGADTTIKDPYQDTALHIAIRINNQEITSLLAQTNLVIDIPDIHGNTPLILAAQKNDLALVQILLSQDAKATTKNAKGWDALRYANRGNYKEIITTLEKAGAKTEKISTRSTLPKQPKKQPLIVSNKSILASGESGLYAGIPPFIQAAWRGQVDIVKSMLSKNADVNIITSNGTTALHLASQAGNVEIVELLLKTTANVNAQNDTGHTALMLAIRNKHADIASLLIDSQADINKQSSNGSSALLYAIKTEQKKLVQQLLTKSADPNIRNNEKEAPLNIAIRLRHISIGQLLLQAGANPNIVDKHGRSPLWYASHHNASDAITSLLRSNASISITDRDGNTPLHIAVKANHPEPVKILLRHQKINISAKNHDGNNALMLAAMSNGLNIIHLLINANSPLNERNNVGDTALIIATRFGNAPVVKALLDAGVDPNLRNNRREWAKSIAESSNRNDLVELINNHKTDKRFFGLF